MKKQKLQKKKKRLFQSRKVIMAVVALLVALTAFAQKELGISMDAGQAVMALGVIGTYLFGEFKSDLARLRKAVFQGKKWQDPAFWVTLAASQLPVINTIFKWDIPVEGINSVVVFIMGVAFKRRVARLKEVE